MDTHWEVDILFRHKNWETYVYLSFSDFVCNSVDFNGKILRDTRECIYRINTHHACTIPSSNNERWDSEYLNEAMTMKSSISIKLRSRQPRNNYSQIVIHMYVQLCIAHTYSIHVQVHACIRKNVWPNLTKNSWVK